MQLVRDLLEVGLQSQLAQVDAFNLSFLSTVLYMIYEIYCN